MWTQKSKLRGTYHGNIAMGTCTAGTSFHNEAPPECCETKMVINQSYTIKTTQYDIEA